MERDREGEGGRDRERGREREGEYKRYPVTAKVFSGQNAIQQIIRWKEVEPRTKTPGAILNTDTGAVSRCHKGVFAQSSFSADSPSMTVFVRTAPVCSRSDQHLCMCTLTVSNTGSHTILRTRKNTAHTSGKG